MVNADELFKGYPEVLMVSVALGAAMFDCVWATRTARFGKAITSQGILMLCIANFAIVTGHIDPE